MAQRIWWQKLQIRTNEEEKRQSLAEKIICVDLGASAGKMLNEYKARIDAKE